jgi:PAS domain S-box-containing protein
MRVSSAAYILFCLVLLFTLFPVWGQDIKELESRLAESAGEERIDLLYELMECYRGIDYEKELAYGEEALQLLEKFSNTQKQVDVMNRLSLVCNYLGHNELSEKYGYQALKISQGIRYIKGIADALYALGRMNYYQGNYDRAKDSLTQALELYEDADLQTEKAQALNTLGLVYWRLSNLSRALRYLLESCKIRENQAGKTEGADSDIAYSYNNIGLIYLEMKNYEKAMENFREALKIHESIDNKGGKAIALNNIAAIYRDQGNYREALDYYHQSLEINRTLRYKHGSVITLKNLGNVYEKLHNLPEAMKYLNSALQISKETNQQKVMSDTLISIGRIKRELGQFQEALRQVRQGLDIALKINVKEEIRSAYQELSEIYTALEDYANALHYLEKTKAVNDSIFTETTSMKIAEMQTRFEMEKKEKDIALLKKNKAVQEKVLVKQKSNNRLILGASLLTFIVLLVFFTRYRARIRMTRTLSSEVREHQRTTRKLQESEETFRLLAEASQVGIYILQNHIVKYVNPAFLAIFHYTGDGMAEILEQDFLKLVIEADRPKVLEKLKQRMNSANDAVRYEFNGMTRTGEILRMESWGGLIHYRGQPAVLETVIDITPREKNQEKWLKSQKLQAMGILAGGIAHDFNNLLAILVGYLDMLKDELPKGVADDEVIENIENAYNQAADLGQKLVVYSKGGWTLPQKVTLTSLLKGALELDSDGEIETFIDLSVPKDLCPIYGDERQLKQAIGYLLADAGSRGIRTGKDSNGLPVTLRAENIFVQEKNDFSLERGEYVRVFLKNSSWRIPPDRLPTIFEPFFSGKTFSDQNPRQVTGLELAICHSIIKKHNGHIEASSEPGQGTTFQLILPVYQAK